MQRYVVLPVLILGLCLGLTFAYKPHQKVDVLVNNVGPFNNPAETYKYYSMPFCQPQKTSDQGENLGEKLAGDRRRNSLYDVRFRVDVQWQALCKKTLTQNDIKHFRDAIQHHYVFEMFVDDLPVRGFVGEMESRQANYGDHVHNDTHYYLFTHLDFAIAYNKNHIIALNLTTDPSQRVELVYGNNIPVEFSYSVSWAPVDVKHEDRMAYHQRNLIGDQLLEIHWLSIVNSLVLVLLLVAFLALILIRMLKKDLARSMELDDQELGAEDEDSGWKLVHGDVFRFPLRPALFAACVGNGAQILALMTAMMMLAMVGTFYPGHRGAVYMALVLVYPFTSVIGGFVSTRLYLQLGGARWASQAVLTAGLFAGPFFAVFLALNSVAVYYGSSSALPFGTIAMVVVLWALLTLPLTILASKRAKNQAVPFDAPCKTARVQREIPAVPWYRSGWVQVLLAGVLPFSAIYIELHYVFASVWGHRAYTVFGILGLAFVLLIVVTACITVALTYFQLAAEDYRWWWRSFASGGATGLFMYLYAFYFFLYRSDMNGVLQGAFFFGYMLMVAYAFFLMLGSVAFFTALKFTRHIYSAIKLD